MVNNSQPDKEQKALELAKTALGWDKLPWAEREARYGELVAKAQAFKEKE
jgi:hypothetical protein